MSESDYPYEVVRWQGEPEAPLTKELLRQKKGISDNTPIETVEFSDFFHPDAPDPDWYGEEEKAQAAKYRHVMSLLAKHLKHLRVFRVGKVEVDIYIVGQTEDGEVVGLNTKAIET